MFETISCKKIVVAAYLLMMLQELICTGSAADRSLRHKRFLIFPRQAPTRHQVKQNKQKLNSLTLLFGFFFKLQFIGGIGIPADLAYESLTIGYVLKAMYWLPWNATHFRENPYLPEYKNEYYNLNTSAYLSNRNKRSSTLRWDIYDILANRLDR